MIKVHFKLQTLVLCLNVDSEEGYTFFLKKDK